MKVKKTIKAKIIALTNIKRKILDAEYDNLQHFLQTGEDKGVYSANKQQALRYYKKIKPDREYPISIRKDLVDVQEGNAFNYFVRIPVKRRRGGLKLPIKTYTNLDGNICESKLTKRGNDYFIHLTIEKDVWVDVPANPIILAVDLGEKTVATSVKYSDGTIMNPRFHGKDIRGIRRHYNWLRKRLGNKKLLGMIRKVGNTEKRKVEDSLHKISRQIVNDAKDYNAIIVLGELKGIRSSAKGKGKRFNRIVSNMPYLKLTQYIEYKALWEGIPVFRISERGTSKHCHRCGNEGKRPKQATFNCECGLKDYHADLNGAVNIAKRFSGQRLENGAIVSKPITEAQISEAHSFSCG